MPHKDEAVRKAYQKRYQAEYRKANRALCNQRQRKCNYRKYGTTPEEVAAQLKKQDNLCAVCGQPFTADDPFVVDHCHEKLRLRGLLHDTCNRLLGFAKNDPQTLHRAAGYLEKFNGQVG